jgi:hypothetical protein
MIDVETGSSALSSRPLRLGVLACLVAFSVGCTAGRDGSVTTPVGPVKPVTPFTPITAVLQKVEVTTLTTGTRPDPDGYGVLNDEWDYDEGADATVPVPTNGTTLLYLRSGAHVLSLVGVAENCDGEELGDRPIFVGESAVTTSVVFRVICKEA